MLLQERDERLEEEEEKGEGYERKGEGEGGRVGMGEGAEVKRRPTYFAMLIRTPLIHSGLASK